MESKQFLEPYPVDLKEREIHRGQHAGHIHKAQQFSYEWGHLFHALLSQLEQGEAKGGDFLKEYVSWTNGEMYDAEQALLKEGDPQVRAHGLTELNFHRLNSAMLDMVWPLFSPDNGWESNQNRNRTLNGAQMELAIKGFGGFLDRERFADSLGGEHALYKEENKALHDAMTGIMQEFDAGIVLIDFVRKHPNLTVLPAPMQFERSRKRLNVDFVVADFVENRAVGIQVKSRVRQEDTEAADPDRVVFLDGDLDFNNIKVVRKRSNSSQESIVAWPGLIAAKKIAGAKFHGKDLREMSHSRKRRREASGSKFLLLLQQQARNRTKDMRVNYEHLVSVIGERILHKL